jgi:hypothetical protein
MAALTTAGFCMLIFCRSPAIGAYPKVYGRIRIAGNAAAGYHRGIGGGEATIRVIKSTALPKKTARSKPGPQSSV